jgi:phage terminase large subunit-like protein
VTKPKDNDEFFKNLSPAQRHAWKWTWKYHARTNQLPPKGEWSTWVMQAGRGFGKTRAGLEQVRLWKNEVPVTHVVGPTYNDLRKVLLEGPSGLLAICPPEEQPEVNLGTMTLTFPNGAKVLMFSAEEPSRLRGPECHKLYCDELASWRYKESFDNATFGLRVGRNPQTIVTTTPKSNIIYKHVLSMPGVIVTYGKTSDNARNLSPLFLARVKLRYGFTRLGRQELDGELLSDEEGALFSRSVIDDTRVTLADVPRDLEQVVIGIDPAVSNNEDSDETGIVAIAKATNGHYYVLADSSGRYDPEQWARASVALYRSVGGTTIVAEVNQGGAMVEATLRNVNAEIPYHGVHASRGKLTRAQPIAALYAQRRVHHVGVFSQLEDQLTTYDGTGESPDRFDACVHALTYASETGGGYALLDLAARGVDIFSSHPKWPAAEQRAIDEWNARAEEGRQRQRVAVVSTIARPTKDSWETKTFFADERCEVFGCKNVGASLICDGSHRGQGCGHQYFPNGRPRIYRGGNRRSM